MYAPIAILFWIVFILFIYVYWNYKKSRNKPVFLQQGLFQSVLWSFIILVPVAIVISMILPEKPIANDIFILHSDFVSDRIESDNMVERYLFSGLTVYSEMNILGFISAILVFLIWFLFIRGLDFYNTEKISHTVSVLVLSILLTTFFVYPWSDLINGIFKIERSNSLLYNLFLYQGLGVGFVEESIKLIPVLIIIYFTEIIEEPIDLIYYSCMSASGFALVENILYFNDLSGSIVIGRALLSAVGHMIASSIVVYGFVLFKFKPHKKNIKVLFYYFFLGCIIHGMYNFLLLESQTLLFVAFFAFVIQAWAIMINNAMNNSPYFDYSIEDKHRQRKIYLTIFLSSITVFSMIVNGFTIGKEEAIYNYMASMFWAVMIIIFYTSGITSFDLFKGFWRPVKFALQRPSTEAMPGMRGVSALSTLWTENTITPMNLVGKRIKLHCPKFNKRLFSIFVIGKGYISNRVKLEIKEKKYDTGWFIVELDEPINIEESYEAKRILIRLKSNYASLIHDEHIECFLKFVPKDYDPVTEPDIKMYPSFGTIIINGEDYEFEN